ncbi:MAG: hypothetical protein AAF211_00415 [Myxococcota bacterium]
MRIELPAKSLEGFAVPPLLLASGDGTELALQDDASLPPLLNRLRTALQEIHHRMVLAERLTSHPLTWWQQLTGVNTEARIRACYPNAPPIGICRTLGVDETQKWLRLQWTDRVLIEVEAASYAADLVVVTDHGLDPSGHDRLRVHVESMLRRRPTVSALVLRTSTGFGLGPWWAESTTPRLHYAGCVQKHP